MRSKRNGTVAVLLTALALAVALALLLAGCGGESTDQSGESQTTESSMKVKEGQDFTISLKSNPTTGFQWELAEPLDEKVVTKVSSEYKPDVSGGSSAVGAGGVEVWTFRATGRGDTEIKLKYVQPWQKDAKPAEERVFKVTVE
ncbi:MAG: protease inhibitor I42 family protein [Actinomycetota bacterium]